LLDLIQQQHLDLSKVEHFVLDEADRMLDMGFIRDIRRIIALLPNKRQNLLFSATYAPEISALAEQILTDPVEIAVAKRNAAADTVSQLVYGINREYKRELLSYLIGNGHWQQVLVFVRTKHGADRLAKQLIKDGIRCAALHGDKSQGARVRALEEFKNGAITALIATDIAARGLDIDQLPHVVNFDLPQVAEDYVHRIGRTGRAGAEGQAISLVDPEEAYLLAAIEKLLKRQIPRVDDTGYPNVSLAVTNSKPQPKPAQPNKPARRPQNGRPGEQAKRAPNSRKPRPQTAKPR
jgi:ATP-dependent RNA helicase RhlE